MIKILNCGSLNLDYVYDVPHFVSAGETLSSYNMEVVCGGKGLNQSIALARGGAKVFHAGKIGCNGGMLESILKENNVDTSYLLKDERENGHAIIQVDRTGQNCILLFSGSNGKIEKREIDSTLENFTSGDYIVLQNEISNVPYIIEKAYEKGLFTVLNPSPITDDILSYPLDKVSLMILNEVEGKAITDEEEPDKIINTLLEKYKGIKVLLSLGTRGSVYADGSKRLKAGIFKAKAVDTTAAGDTMLGFFVSALSRGLDEGDALILATKASALAVSQKGAAPSIPTLDEAEKCDFEYIE